MFLFDCRSVERRFVPRRLAYDHVGFKRYLDRHCRLVTDMRVVDPLMDSFAGSLLGLRKLCIKSLISSSKSGRRLISSKITGSKTISAASRTTE